jgi:hypothetical protein
LTSARHEFYNSNGADFPQGLLNVMKTKLIVTTALLLGLAALVDAGDRSSDAGIGWTR